MRAGPVPSSDASPAVRPRPRVLATFPFHNEREKLARLAPRIRDGLADKWLPVDDGSTDGGAEILRERGIEVLRQEQRRGIGSCLKRCVRYGRENGFDVLVVMAGNNKDDPEEIPRLLRPIEEEGADYVQGSRFLSGGSSPHLPVFRRVTIRLLSFLFRLYTRRTCSDLTNGFRAYRLRLFDDRRIDIEQDWLDQYEYEYYVHWKAYTLGYKVVEVPVSKTYPGERGAEYSKIKPFSGWWRMLRPFVFLALRIKR
jgi:dolichol-phosphate mannosyltransferase